MTMQDFRSNLCGLEMASSKSISIKVTKSDPLSSCMSCGKRLLYPRIALSGYCNGHSSWKSLIVFLAIARETSSISMMLKQVTKESASKIVRKPPHMLHENMSKTCVPFLTLASSNWSTKVETSIKPFYAPLWIERVSSNSATLSKRVPRTYATDWHRMKNAMQNSGYCSKHLS